MPIQTVTLSVLIASPGDTAAERDAVEDVIRSFNSDHTLQRKVHLLPLRWELGAVPRLDGRKDAQTLINEQFADAADIVVALFNSRLGQATRRAVSGTAEEVLRARDRGAQVHVFFSEAPVPRDHDPAQLAALNAFRLELQGHGLTRTYASGDELRTRVRTCLEHDAYLAVDAATAPGPAVAATGDPRAASGARALLRCTHLADTRQIADLKGRVRTMRHNHRLRVENLGDVAADDVALAIEPVGEGSAPEFFGMLVAERIPSRAYVDFPLAMDMGVAPQGRVTQTWSEKGVQRSEVQTISWI
ncbi:hypothetical protein [Streptomyces sp. SP18CS02]|uniref:hypothetical protein n=1 Tax=Streptomyces sp. SP18CS02 TaxID=3002531 RepID=UPI002E75F077|nr:hypothetical protein [Streptomyces sp. SP18CS02]MEE1757444.1 hypothetical protein [Streptomyces sp. SP18CS02]